MPRRTTFQNAAESAAKDGAAHWLAVLSDSDCSEADRKAFFHWLRSGTSNVDEFLRLSALIRGTQRRELWPETDLDALIEAARTQRSIAEFPRAQTQTQAPRRRYVAALAASLLCAIGLGTFAVTSTDWIEGLTSTYRTGVGEQRSIVLEDGSVIELNSRSSLRSRFSEDLRSVEMMTGEAIFRVAKDSSRPFRVRTGVTDIVAIGTAFNVSADESGTVVTVLEGKVRVNDRKRSGRGPRLADYALEGVELSQGDQLVVALEKPVLRIALPDTERVTSWTERRLIFESTSIASAAAEFARYSPKQIKVRDAALGERRITGVFDATDPESLVQFLATDENIRVRRDGEGWSVELLRGR